MSLGRDDRVEGFVRSFDLGGNDLVGEVDPSLGPPDIRLAVTRLTSITP